MTQIELRATNLHWLEVSNPFEDCCVHGGVCLTIGDIQVSDGIESDWTVSTAAFNLLRTLEHDHTIKNERPLVPHCGHTMWVVNSEQDGLFLGGCDIGIDWEVRHRSDKVLHIFGKDKTVETSREIWRSEVCKFSDEVYAFFLTAWPKVIQDEDDRKGFELFMQLWTEMRARAFNR
ncbi:MAG TPA: hypothetical protein VK468_10655 [Pyrinomonadaceae bacterium]|nr:hypothetical protein [Pyrinomonadaceae bacterium]